MLTAKEIRSQKVLTDEMLKELISIAHPLMIDKVGEGSLKVVKITDMSGLQTSHYMMMDLLTEDNKELIAALPADTIVPVGPVYTISYQNEGGVIPESVVVRSMADKKYTLTASDLPEIEVEEGYEFKGWSLNGRILGVGDTIESTVTLVAVIEEESAEEITYVLNYESELPGSTNFPEDKEVTANAEGKYTLTAEDLPTPTHEEDQFDGWFYDNGEQAQVGDVLEEDVTLTAKWTTM